MIYPRALTPPPSLLLSVVLSLLLCYCRVRSFYGVVYAVADAKHSRDTP